MVNLVKPKTAVVWTCGHSDPGVSNERFDWLGKFIEDIKPDFTVDLGDSHDMRSLNSYDERYPKAVCAQSYEADVEHAIDSEERIWGNYKKKKKKRPYRFKLQGNHEYRLDKAIALNPRIAGNKYGISHDHFGPTYYSEEYHAYSNSAPALVDIEGITFAHFVASGNYGAAIGGEHHAHSLLKKLACSAVVGHSHKLDFHRQAGARPNAIQAVVTGCYKGREEAWAGQANNDWTAGVSVFRNIRNGDFDWQWVGISELKREYKIE